MIDYFHLLRSMFSAHVRLLWSDWFCVSVELWGWLCLDWSDPWATVVFLLPLSHQHQQLQTATRLHQTKLMPFDAICSTISRLPRLFPDLGFPGRRQIVWQGRSINLSFRHAEVTVLARLDHSTLAACGSHFQTCFWKKKKIDLSKLIVTKRTKELFHDKMKYLNCDNHWFHWKKKSSHFAMEEAFFYF